MFDSQLSPASSMFNQFVLLVHESNGPLYPNLTVLSDIGWLMECRNTNRNVKCCNINIGYLGMCSKYQSTISRSWLMPTIDIVHEHKHTSQLHVLNYHWQIWWILVQLKRIKVQSWFVCCRRRHCCWCRLEASLLKIEVSKTRKTWLNNWWLVESHLSDCFYLFVPKF